MTAEQSENSVTVYYEGLDFPVLITPAMTYRDVMNQVLDLDNAPSYRYVEWVLFDEGNLAVDLDDTARPDGPRHMILRPLAVR